MEESNPDNNETAVLNLLTLSSENFTTGNNCVCELPVAADDLAGWRRPRQKRGHKSPPCKTRSKGNSSKRGAGSQSITAHENAGLLKGSSSRKKTLNPNSSQETLASETSNLHGFVSHEDHVNFYTEHYSSTKEITKCCSTDNIYEPRRGDTRALSTRLKILELLSDSYHIKKQRELGGEHKSNGSTSCHQLQSASKSSENITNNRGSLKDYSAAGRLCSIQAIANEERSSIIGKKQSELVMVVSPNSRRKYWSSCSLGYDRNSRQPIKPPTEWSFSSAEHQTYRLRAYDLPGHKLRKPKDRLSLGKVNINQTLSHTERNAICNIANAYAYDQSSVPQKTLKKVIISYSDSKIGN